MTSLFLIALLATAPLWATAAEVTLIIDYPSISPNDDLIKDEFSVSMILANPVDTVMVTIEDVSLTTVHDTIFLMDGLAAGEYTAGWDGRDFTGLLLPEGDYVLRLYESTGSVGEYQQRSVIIDLTPPSIAIDRIEPGVFSPGFPSDTSTVDIYYIVSDYETGAVGQISFVSPEDAEFDFPIDVSGDGEHFYQWAPLAEYPSGIYSFEVSITDYAGNSSSDAGAIELDTDKPAIGSFTEIVGRTPAPPETIFGYAHDTGGIKTGSFKLRWSQNDADGVPYESEEFDPDDSWTQNDTLFWTFELPDTVDGTVSYTENSYMLKASCYDNFDQYSQTIFSFILDRTPPSAPIILNPGGTVIRTPLELELDYDSDVDSLFISRLFLGVVTVDSILQQAPHVVDLEPGVNEIWVSASDQAGNHGPDSERLEVELTVAASISFPEAFRGPGTFQIITAEAVRGIVIYIFDIAGEHVRRLEDWSGSTVYTIDWDLLNDDGETVRNGPYVIVMTIYNYDGTKTVKKEFVAVVK